MVEFNVNFEKVQFVEDSQDWLFRIFHFLARLLAIVTSTTIWPRVILRGIRKWLDFTGICIYGNSLGFSDTTLKSSLTVHERRYKHYFFLFTLSVILLTAAMVPIVRILGGFMQGLIETYSLLSILYLLFAAVTSLVATLTTFKLAFFILERYFADTLCILSVFAILFELTLDDILTNAYRKRILLRYVNDLARNTMLLSASFVQASTDKSEIKQHFQKMEKFVREREKRIILSTEDALEHLRQDFYFLAKIYLSGNYGQFDGSDNSGISTPEQIMPLQRRVLIGITRVLGLILPIVLWFLLVNNRSVFSDLGFDTNALALVLIAWFLAFLDTTLGLGITSTIVTVFKEFKEIK